jgi:uncharacterized protein YqeY
MPSPIAATISAETKQAMRSRDKARLAILRMIGADFKRVEVDERIELDDTRCIAILIKMSKQRKDALSQYESAGREDLAEIERNELSVIQEFLPSPLSNDEIVAIIDDAMTQTGATAMAQMGSVMAIIKPKIEGRGDLGAVSKLVREKLA